MQPAGDPTLRSDPPRRASSASRVALMVLLVLFFLVALQRAWLSDDAYITFRTLDNLVHGFRLTWNVTERVQAYTHPLWLFLLTPFYAASREIFHTAISVCLGVSFLAVVAYAYLQARTWTGAALGVLILTLSNAFIDYSTSGLENPLTHLLLVLFWVVYFKGSLGLRRFCLLSLLASLGAVNRLDTVLLYAPALLLAFLELPEKKNALLLGIAGQAPLLLWEAFSVFYYGFPFPNTAYAKLNTGVPGGELLRQGLFYLLNSLQRDPLTLAAVLFFVLVAFAGRRQRASAVGLGVLLYLAYVVKIGGDFMSGRFLSAPLVCAVAILGQLDFRHTRPGVRGLAFAGVLALGLAAPTPTFLLQPLRAAPLVDAHGIADERAWYFPDAGLINAAGKDMPTSVGHGGGLAARQDSQTDLQVVVLKNTGVYGYFAGPQVFVIDYLALSDPLLARMPALREVHWRVGHYPRVVPEGYLSTVYTGTDLLEDENLGKFYDQLALITRGPLFSPERFVAIWKMNTGQFDDLIDQDRYRYPDMVLTRLEAGQPMQPYTFADSGTQITLAAQTDAAALDLELDGDSRYQVEYWLGTRLVGQAQLDPQPGAGGPVVQHLATPAQAARTGFDRLRIFPLSGDDPYVLASITLEGTP
ncbi:MAG: hypothetical protein VB089_21770 [Anaerolineaceae bacterium]|nr:hypothetical protein [Anaerolineaceae bacterium]